MNADAVSPAPGLIVRWSIRPWHDKKKSLSEGRPCYVDREWISIRVPGDNTFGIDHFASDDEKAQHAESLAAFKRNHSSEGVIGTLLEEWPQITRSQAEELRNFGIKTVEQLAALTDANAKNVPRGSELRAQAKAYLDAAKAGAPTAKLAEEVRQMKNEIEALRRERDEAMKALDKATTPNKGR